MGLANVLPYFRECLCDLGYEEWEVEIDSENPPKTINEKSFRLTMGNVTIAPARHTTFSFTVPVVLNLYFNTHRDPVEGMDCALEDTDLVLCNLLDVEKRYGSVLKSVSPTSIIYEAIDATNDNILKAVIDFDIVLELEYRQ